MMRRGLAWILVLALGVFTGGGAGAQESELAKIEELLKQKQHEQALERVESYLAKRPKEPRGRFLKGVILSEQKKVADAIKVFFELTHDYPELPEPYNNLAVLHAGQGEYEQARSALEMAVRANPRYAIAYENLGDVYARMAGQSYEKAARLDKANKIAPLKLKAVNEMLSTAFR
jgi:tetratricopeptide (TPR) repeat protein